MLEVIQIPVLNDNYVYLLVDRDTALTAVVDPAVAAPINRVLEERGLQLNFIFNTHHHADHTGANLELKKRWSLEIYGPAKENIPGIDVPVREGDRVEFGGSTAVVLETPGHTSGHIVYHFPKDRLLFCGDTIFAMGCGRLFEGTPAQMWQSLSKIAALPKNTLLFCAHEYTQKNGEFALTVDSKNLKLQSRMETVRASRQAKEPTVPITLEDELMTNPFLRAGEQALQEATGESEPVAVFAELRRRKDRF